MKKIDTEKSRLLELYASKICGFNNSSQCDRKICKCAMLAQVKAYINVIIPEGYRKFSIHDFDGISENGETILNPDVAIRVKKQIAEYCWGDMTLNELQKLSVGELSKRSVISSRIDSGNNIIIYGAPKTKIHKNKEGETDRIEQPPLGRTFIAHRS